MRFQLSPADQIQLHSRLASSLGRSLRDPAQSEPRLVANLVYQLPRAVNSFGLFSSRTHAVRAGGIFVHQQPQVVCKDYPDPSPASVEIGDLLLLRTEVRGAAIASRSALLLQAKKYKRLPAKPDNKNQHHLYANWPSFTYTRATKKLNGKKRHIAGPDLYSGSKYLLIDSDTRGCMYCPTPHSSNTCKGAMTAHPTLPALNHYRCFLQEIFEFVLGDVGKSFRSPPQARTRGWDRVIEDLITVTANRATKYIVDTFFGGSSYRGQGLCFVTGHFSGEGSLRILPRDLIQQDTLYDGPPEVPTEYYEDGPDGGGIPIIEFVVTSQTEEGEEE